ncbi:MAG: 2-dehydropantoate 2-reductase [Planococcus donghaensis]
MKILVVGAGAMGSLFAGRLKTQTSEVFLYNRKNSHVEKINQCGLTIIEQDNNKTVIPLTVVQEVSKDYDLVLVMLKTHATKAVLTQLKNSFSLQTLFVTMQNGLGNLEILAEIFPNNSLVAGTMGSGANIESDGQILHRGFGTNFVGQPTDKRAQEKLVEFVGLLNQSGLETELADDVQAVIWNKLFVNLAYNSLTALTRLRNGDILNTVDGQNLLRSIVTEAIEIAEAEGIHVETETIIAKCIKMGQEQFPANKSSMLMDVLHERKTEIDAINGAVANLGKKHGILTPYNDMITGIIKVIEANYSKQVD